MNLVRSYAGLIGFAVACVALPALAEDLPARPACHRSGNDLVIARDRSDGPGQDIYVRSGGASAKAPCTYAPGPKDFVIKSDDSYFSALQGGFLALDAGTGPDRDVVIYDLATRKKLLDVGYDSSRPVASAIRRLYLLAGRLEAGQAAGMPGRLAKS